MLRIRTAKISEGFSHRVRSSSEVRAAGISGKSKPGVDGRLLLGVERGLSLEAVLRLPSVVVGRSVSGIVDMAALSVDDVFVLTAPLFMPINEAADSVPLVMVREDNGLGMLGRVVHRKTKPDGCLVNDDRIVNTAVVSFSNNTCSYFFEQRCQKLSELFAVIQSEDKVK